MNKNTLNCWKILLALLGLVTLATAVDAQPFVYKTGDLLLGFRKTGTNQGLNEAVVDIGPATNFVNFAAGTSNTITQYSASQIVPDSFANLTFLSWSVSGYVLSSRTFTNYAADTLWVTVPRVGGVQAPAANRDDATVQESATTEIQTIGNGAKIISQGSAAGADNTVSFVQEAYANAQGLNYGAWVNDPTYSNIGDLQGYAPHDVNGKLLNIENTTPAPFAAAVQSDLYELVPLTSVDPNNGSSSGAGYYVGYFQLNTNGTMSFFRASATAPAPVAGFSGSPTNGFAPLSAVFTDASTGTVTNWLWNFGDGVTVTNTSNASVNHNYASAGNYTVSLKATGPGGSDTSTKTAYVVVASTPSLNGVALVNGKLVFGGANGPAGVQYRILKSTNLTLALANWTPVTTNFYLSNGSFSYTNSTTNLTGFFRLVSP